MLLPQQSTPKSLSPTRLQMLIQISKGAFLKRNPAARRELEERGLITVINREKWQLELTDAGRAILAESAPNNIAASSTAPVTVSTVPAPVPTSILKVNSTLLLLFEDIGSTSDHSRRQYRKVRMNIMHRAEDERIGTFLTADLHLSQVDLMIERLTQLRQQMLPGGEPASAAPEANTNEEAA